MTHVYAPRDCSAPRKRHCSRTRLMQPRAWAAPVSGVRGARCAPCAWWLSPRARSELGCFCALPLKERAFPASSGSCISSLIARNSAGFSRRCLASASARRYLVSSLLCCLVSTMSHLCLCSLSSRCSIKHIVQYLLFYCECSNTQLTLGNSFNLCVFACWSHGPSGELEA